MSLLGKGDQSQDALKATTSLMEMRAESREFYDAPMMTRKEKKKKEKKEKKQKLLMAKESSSTSHHPEEDKGHKQQQREMAPLLPVEAEIQQEMAFQKRKAVSLERSVATGGEERKKTTKIVFKFSPHSSSQPPPPPLPPPREMASLTSSTAEDETEIWRTMALQKGLSEPDFYFSKTVTTTDTKKDQNRYEISVDNMANKMALQELAIRVNSKPEVKVMVMDKKGQEYQLFFRYIPSNGRYRFNGPEFKRFIEDNNLQAGQIMRIYGLHDESGGNWGFAFINTDV